MGKIFSLIIAGILITANINAVSISDTMWTRSYGGDSSETGASVQSASGGTNGFVVAGTTNSFGAGAEDFFLVRTNSSGDTIWTRTYGGASSDIGYSVQENSDGGFIIAGTTNSFGAGAKDVYLVRTNSSGAAVWTKTFGDVDDEEGYSVQSISGGTNGFIVAGSTHSFGLGSWDIYVVRTNSSGDTIWTRTYGGNKNDWGTAIQKTQDGGFIITGEVTSFGAGAYDAYLVRTDSLGDTLWTRTFGGTDYDYSNAVQQTQDGGFIIAGATASFGTGTPSYSNVYVVKTNSSGDTLWTRVFGGAKDDYANAVIQTQDGGFVIVGQTKSFGVSTPASFNIYIIKINSSGDVLWTKILGGNNSDIGNSVQLVSDADSGFVVAATIGTYSATSGNAYLIRLGKEVGVEEISNIKNQKLNIEIGQTPFSKSTTISCHLPINVGQDFSLAIYDIRGSRIKTLVAGQKPAGSYSTTLSAKDLKTGIYFLTLTSGTLKTTKKITIIK